MGAVLAAAATGGMMIESVRGVKTRRVLGVPDGVIVRYAELANSRDTKTPSVARTNPTAEA